MPFLRTGNTIAITGVIAASLAALFGTGRALLNHEGNVGLWFVAQASLLVLLIVPQVLAEVRDRKTLSIYDEMYIGR